MPRYLVLRMSPRLARLAVVVIALGLVAGDALAPVSYTHLTLPTIYSV